MANVVARSAFVNMVDPDLCAGCETCVDYCQFDALSLEPADAYIQISAYPLCGLRRMRPGMPRPP